jgi:hypothetical protein
MSVNRIAAYMNPKSGASSGPPGPSGYARIEVLRDVLPIGCIFLERGSVVAVRRPLAESLARAGVAEILPE